MEWEWELPWGLRDRYWLEHSRGGGAPHVPSASSGHMLVSSIGQL